LRFGVLVSVALASGSVADERFDPTVRPIFERHCLGCHGVRAPKGGLSLASAAAFAKGGDSGPAVVPGKPEESELVRMISGPKPEMPQRADPLRPEEVRAIEEWVRGGAVWPSDATLVDRSPPAEVWWSLKPLVGPPVPKGSATHPIDRFVDAGLAERKLKAMSQADRRTLMRRLSFDLLGLPPDPAEVEAFVRDPDPAAYEKLVDRLLASPHYGERQARAWLDVVHYGDTHGYDKDKVRPNAWPYRDYVIRAFNDDKPFDRFLLEQLAGDVIAPGSVDGITALGFLAAGPWDFVGHVELREGTIDKAITRNLDRDDMVATTLNTFCSLTVQCARCHDHKFDPISQEEYYRLQAVFAAVDRADRPVDLAPITRARRTELERTKTEVATRRRDLERRIGGASDPGLAALARGVADLGPPEKPLSRSEFGYHSSIESVSDRTKWIQFEFPERTPLASVTLLGCHDDFGGIGAGFGFPVRYRIELADDPGFRTGVTLIADRSAADQANPGTEPRGFDAGSKAGRFLRLTVTRLAKRADDFNFALAELICLTPDGVNIAPRAKITASDEIEAPPRWRRANLVDGRFVGSPGPDKVAEFARRHRTLERRRDERLTPALRTELADLQAAERANEEGLRSLPPPLMVYAVTTDFPAFAGFTPTKGTPRPIHLLHRGSERQPTKLVTPGTLAAVPGLSGELSVPESADEGQRRLALARWILDPKNPLVWRSIVNRVWQSHFGRGLVETPNDFGRMGAKPTHPELLDHLAAEFRGGDRRLKSLHRGIVTSAAYRRASSHDPASGVIDAGNQFLWRMNRRRLDAEEIRDAVLVTAGKLDRAMLGPAFRPFGFKDDHSPHYLYEQHNPDDPASHRRSIYRFLVRSVPEPFMETLDCADPSQAVARRNETLTALQALALLNNPFMVRMSERFAERVTAAEPRAERRPATAFRMALGRQPRPEELEPLVAFADRSGLPAVCRLILNLNEFSFVD
jgi:hypothetical protein